MKHFTIDSDNNITVHGSKTAARETGAAVFSTEAQFADVIGPDNKRLVEIWNSLPGVKPVTKFANRKVAAERIWKAIQELGEAPAPAPTAEPPANASAAEMPSTEVSIVAPTTELAPIEPSLKDPLQITAEPAGDPVDQPAEAVAVSAQVPDVAPAETESSVKPGRARKAPKAPKVAKPAKSESGPREGSKTAQVVEMLKREGGATMAEIMSTMGWQKHTVRGFMAGAMKKAGYTVESFKPEGGERTYRIK